ncbi:Tyrosine kinase domain protein [Ceratobasidium sp. AG-Ba]|nr:Tyrosine kinase domain protein [Ceratobasidium sp. AG-Ba]
MKNIERALKTAEKNERSSEASSEATREESSNETILCAGAASDIFLSSIKNSPNKTQVLDVVLFSQRYLTECIFGQRVLKVIRVLLADFQETEEDHQLFLTFQDEFRQSVKCWMKLQHKNVAHVGALLGAPDRLGFFSTYYPQGSLRSYIAQHLKGESQATRSRINALIMDVVTGLEYLHSQNPPVVHGNINADKVYVDAEGIAKLGEFGLAASTLSFPDLVPAISHAGLVRWMSPEQFELEEQPTIYSDVWALGCTILEMITGRLPYHNHRQDAKVTQKILSGEMPGSRPQNKTSDRIDFEYQKTWDVIELCWTTSPVARPSCAKLLEKISSCTAEAPPRAYMSESDYSNLHGLIIGINKYKSSHNADLDGCVSDATSVLNYLVQDLGVPRGQILTLFDEQATREGIITAFWTHLIHNGSIKPSDPIVIYYAGQGESALAPPEIYSSDGQWEFILPHDGDTTNRDETYIFGIEDRTLGALIYELNKEKGDNITVILDCSFSGRMIKAPAAGSFVLLAACRDSEQAQTVQNMDPITNKVLEPPVTGLFTSSLLKALRQCNPAVTSYSEIMRIVISYIQKEVSRSGELTTQVPQCEGKNKDRILFQTRFAMTEGMIALLPTRDRTMFRIKAGSASGIQVGTELDIYSGNMSIESTPLAKLVAIEVTPTEAVLSVPDTGMVPEVPQNAYVVITKYNSQGVRILVEDESKLLPVWNEVFDNLRSLPIEVVFSKPGEPSDLVLVPAEDEVKLQRQDPSLIQLEPKDLTLQHSLGAEELTRRMTFIIQFHFHLQRRNPDSPLKGQVDMQLIELKNQINPILRIEEFVPLQTRTNLFGDSLVTGAVAELPADPYTRYGLVLTNRSNWPLYAYVLYFDLEDYSIGCLYEPPSRSSKPPLTNDWKELPVGYGSSGTDPLRVESTTGAPKETGFFMLFVSSSWVDISHIEQPSPFEQESGDARRRNMGRKAGLVDMSGDSRADPIAMDDRKRHLGHSRPTTLDASVWDVILIPVSIIRVGEETNISLRDTFFPSLLSRGRFGELRKPSETHWIR